jgi:uncharacterized DUF497 family protein
MEITWDERKRATNLRTHSLDFADVSHRFEFSDAVVEPAHPSGGRPRFKMVGRLDGDLVAFIFSPLGTEAISLISLRRASRKERSRYDQRQQAFDS